MSALWRDLRDKELASTLAEANPQSWNDYLRIVQRRIPDAHHTPLAELIGKRPPRRDRKPPIPRAMRWDVYERDDFTCRYCGSRRFLSVDHIYPWALGGPTTLENLQTLCSTCNSWKGTKVVL